MPLALSRVLFQVVLHKLISLVFTKVLIIICGLEMEVREVKYIAQGHRTPKCLRQCLNLACLGPAIVFFTAIATNTVFCLPLLPLL